MDGYTFAGIFLLALWTVLFVGAFLCSAREQRTRPAAKKTDKPQKGGNADAA